MGDVPVSALVDFHKPTSMLEDLRSSLRRFDDFMEFEGSIIKLLIISSRPFKMKSKMSSI